MDPIQRSPHSPELQSRRPSTGTRPSPRRPGQFNRGWIAGWLCSLTCLLHGAESTQSALQRGLVAEEAQRDLIAARAAYEEAVRIGEAERQAMAAALYRLGDIQRRLGDTNAARIHFSRLIQDFPDQTNLVALALREVPAALEGRPSTALLRARLQEVVALAVSAETRAAEIGRQLEAIKLEDPQKFIRPGGTVTFDQETMQLRRDQSIANRERARLDPALSPNDPEVRRVEELEKKSSLAIQNYYDAQLLLIKQRYEAEKKKAAFLAQQAADLEAQLKLAEATASPKDSDDDPFRYLRAEIDLAEEQLKITEKRFSSGTASQEEVIKARREVLALQRQLASRPKLTEVVIPAAVPESGPDKAEFEELTRLRRLAAESPDLLRRPADGLTPLQSAAGKGWTNVVLFLLDAGVPPDSADRNDRGTALHRAARAGNQDLVALLLDRGANVNSLGNSTETPLHAAVRAGHRAVAELLLQRGAVLESATAQGGQPYSGWESYNWGNTPLHLAAYYGLPALVELLIRHGANLEAVNQYGMTPVVAAMLGQQEECVEKLLAAGANPNAFAWLPGRNNPAERHYQTPVLWTVTANQLPVLKSLLDHGASARTSDVYGNTPLHWARSREAVTALLNAGAAVNALNLEGQTPLDVSEGSAAVCLQQAGGTNAAPSRPLEEGSAGLKPPPPPGFQKPPQISLFGEVVAKVPMTAGQPVDLRELLSRLNPPASADLSRISIQRQNPRTNFVVDVSPLPGRKPEPGPELFPDDLIFVPPKGTRKP